MGIPHGHYKTITLVAGLRLSGLVAQKAYDRPMNAATFEDWVEKCLVPTLSQGDVVVMDNLSSHKGPRVEQLIKAAGAELLYLPPYSPDMKSHRKSLLQAQGLASRKIAERTVTGLLNALERLRRNLQTRRMRELLQGLRIRYRLIGNRSKHKRADRLAAASEAFHVVGWSRTDVVEALGIQIHPLLDDPLPPNGFQRWEPWPPRAAQHLFDGAVPRAARASRSSMSPSRTPSFGPDARRPPLATMKGSPR